MISKLSVRLAFLSTLTAILTGSLALSAQQTTFHVDVKLVNVFVNVTDRNGAIVGGLTRDDFAVFEDDRPQTDRCSSSASRSCR